MPTPHDLTCEHARAMRIVRAVLAACDPRAATASAARAHGLTTADGRWVLAIGKAAIGMAEGLADHCGLPDRHLIVTVDGPQPSGLTNILRSDHPLPTRRSLDAGQAVKRFIEEAQAAGAPGITALISGGASSLICEPIPGIDLDDYRAVVRAMLTAGWNIQRMNTVRRAIDELKGGGLAALAAPLPVDLLVISDVIGNTLHDVGSGPFVTSPTSPDDARALLERMFEGTTQGDVLLNALSCRPRSDAPLPPQRAIIALDNSAAVHAAESALSAEGLSVVSSRTDLSNSADAIATSAGHALRALNPREAIVWGGEWPVESSGQGFGGRCQFLADGIARRVHWGAGAIHAVAIATDGADGIAPPGVSTPAGAYVYSGMSWAPINGPELEGGGSEYQAALASLQADLNDDLPLIRWAESNSYYILAHRDKHRRAGEPPSHIFTGPTGTNVNDLLIAWRV